jgi:hypothetical protein
MFFVSRIATVAYWTSRSALALTLQAVDIRWTPLQYDWHAATGCPLTAIESVS